MGAFIDLTSNVYGRLTVIKKVGINNWRDSLWECLCSCGNIKVIAGGDLKKSKVKSCGCYNKEISIINNTTHGLKHHNLYAVHQSIIQRCTNPNNKGYKNYGAKGITIDNSWLDFLTFYNWCNSNNYSSGMQLDRKDTTKGYNNENCQFLTPSEHSLKTNKWRWRKEQ